MKKGFSRILAAGLVLSASAGLVACSDGSNNNNGKYLFYNYDSTYNVNEEFSIVGTKLKITKSDGSIKEVTVTESMIKSMPDMTTAGIKTIVVVYEDIEYKFTIEVVEIEQGVTVVNSSFTGIKPKYYLNEAFDYSNIRLNLTLSDGTNPQIVITASMIESMPDMTTEGVKTVVVNYNGEQYSFTFEVSNSENEMLTKLQNFMKDYNSASVKDSSIKINIEGVAKYLKDSAEFNNELMNIQMSRVLDIEGYQIAKIGEGLDTIYVFVKEFDNMEDLNNEYNNCNISLINTNYFVILQSADGSAMQYGSVYMDDIISKMSNGEEFEYVSLDEFKNYISLTQIYSEDSKYITVFDSVFAQPIYKAITNAIVKSTMDISNNDIVSAKDSLTAKLDVVKTLNNISTNMANVDFYGMFINDMLLTESDVVYVDLAKTHICYLFDITDQDTIDQLEYVLTKDIRKIRTTSFAELDIYNMIVQLNDIIKASNGNPTAINQLDIIVSSLDGQDKHILSKFVYSIKDFVTISQTVYDESSDYNYINNVLGGVIYDYYHNGTSGVYKYYYEKEVDEPEMVEAYYAGLKSLIEKFENIEQYSSVKTFANDIINDLKAIDAVNKEMEENEYYSDLINYGFTSSIRQAIEYYIEMYDAEMIADIIDMLALTQPKDSKIYKVLGESMHPTICDGNKVLVQPMESYRIGDIIAFETEIGVVVHRIVRITYQGETAYYTCEGNNYTIYSEPVAKDQVLGVVTEINPLYVGLDENLVTALKDCSDIIYLAFKPNGKTDYIKLIEDVCDRIGVEKDYYIEQFKAGEITIFTDLYDKYVTEEYEFEGAELEFINAMRNTCLYLDSIFIYGSDRTEFINEINKCAKAIYDLCDSYGTENEVFKMYADCLVKMTSTEKDFYANLKDIIVDYKSTAKEYIKLALVSGLKLDTENETAIKELEHIINYHLTAYIADELVVSEAVGDLNNYIDKYCDNETKVFVKANAILGAILMGQDENVDYNELLAGIELPKEVEEIDFNKLIKETLKDKDTYDILSLEDAKVDYITDEQGNIVKEVLTVYLKANYDILVSSLDAKVVLTIEINF